MKFQRCIYCGGHLLGLHICTPQGTAERRSAPPEGEGLKATSRAVRSDDSDIHDPTEETHP